MCTPILSFKRLIWFLVDLEQLRTMLTETLKKRSYQMEGTHLDAQLGQCLVEFVFFLMILLFHLRIKVFNADGADAFHTSLINLFSSQSFRRGSSDNQSSAKMHIREQAFFEH